MADRLESVGKVRALAHMLLAIADELDTAQRRLRPGIIAAASAKLRKARELTEQASRLIDAQAETERDRAAQYLEDGARHKQREAQIAYQHGATRGRYSVSRKRKVAGIKPPGGGSGGADSG